MNIQKCAVIGCGAVGATTAYTLLGSGLFNEMVLIDVDQGKARGEAMDIGHCVPFIRPVEIYAGGYQDIRDAFLVIITAGANQLPGETRMDLVKKNAGILRHIIPEILKYNTDCTLLVVANPVDVLTNIALKISGFEKHRVIGSGTVLDTARFKYLLGEYFKVDHRNVHAFVIGEHGDSELAVWSSANLSGIELEAFCRKRHICMDRTWRDGIEHDVKASAYEIIENKGATYYAVAQAVKRIAESIVRNEGSILTVSGYCDGDYGLHGLCIGLPMIVGRKGILDIIELTLNDEEARALAASARMLEKGLHESGF